MGVKKPINLPPDLRSTLDEPDKNGSAILERDVRNRRDIEIINPNAQRLNKEATDTLGYQRLT